AISSLGNASGLDMRLADRDGLGYDALMAATQVLLMKTSQRPMLDRVRLTGLSDGVQLATHIDRWKADAQRVDLTAQAQLTTTSLGSVFVGNFTNHGWVQNVWVQADQNHRMTNEEILALNARNNQGGMVPLSAFVTLGWKPGAT